MYLIQNIDGKGVKLESENAFADSTVAAPPLDILNKTDKEHEFIRVQIHHAQNVGWVLIGWEPKTP